MNKYSWEVKTSLKKKKTCRPLRIITVHENPIGPAVWKSFGSERTTDILPLLYIILYIKVTLITKAIIVFKMDKTKYPIMDHLLNNSFECGRKTFNYLCKSSFWKCKNFATFFWQNKWKYNLYTVSIFYILHVFFSSLLNSCVMKAVLFRETLS